MRFRLPLSVAAAVSCCWCASASALDLYNGSLGTTPESQGWVNYFSDNVGTIRNTANGTTTFNSTAIQSERCGYSNYAPFPVNAGFPTLNRSTGYVVSVSLRVIDDNHVSNDRSGVSLSIISSDQMGIELAFWQNEVWAQSGADFLHAEGAAFDTTAAIASYDVAISGSNYQLFVNGSSTPLLQGPLRNYSAGGFIYPLPSAVFLGDNTTSASGIFEFSRLAVNVPEPSMSVGMILTCLSVRRRR